VREIRVTGPWLRAARFEGGLLIPGRPRGRAFDLLLTPEHALLRGDGELVLPWSSHLDFTKDVVSSQGWCLDGWDGNGGAGAALHLLGDLDQQAQTLPWMSSWSARWHRTPNWGCDAPLHKTNLNIPSHQSDRDVLQALCVLAAQRPDLRVRLGDEATVTALVARVVTSSHVRGYALDGARRDTIAVASALDSLGLIHRIGGRPLPDERVPTADELLPGVLGAIKASPYARGVAVDVAKARSIVERQYSGVPPWPFEPLFLDSAL
jgi:hypothetical protein